jgi:LysR family hydrogen peroxide-inducible transcriptional activator
MAVAVETRSANVSVARFEDPQPSRTVGMVWRKTSPLTKQLFEIAEVVRSAAGGLTDKRRIDRKAQLTAT